MHQSKGEGGTLKCAPKRLGEGTSPEGRGEAEGGVRTKAANRILGETLESPMD